MIKKGFLVMIFLTLFLIILASTPSAPLRIPRVPAIKGWEMRIETHTLGETCYCYIGEKRDASNGVDQYDVPHPPLFPPGRAWIFLKQPSFPDPYKTLLYEYKKFPQTQTTWNLTTFFDNSYGADVVLEWNSSISTEYKTIYLIHNSNSINMKQTNTYTFWNEPYQMTNMNIVCSKYKR